jgi:hypothetical protein
MGSIDLPQHLITFFNIILHELKKLLADEKNKYFIQ